MLQTLFNERPPIGPAAMLKAFVQADPRTASRARIQCLEPIRLVRCRNWPVMALPRQVRTISSVRRCLCLAVSKLLKFSPT